MGMNYEGISDRKEYVYIYKRGGVEFVTASYNLAHLRNQTDDIFILNNEGEKYLLITQGLMNTKKEIEVIIQEEIQRRNKFRKRACKIKKKRIKRRIKKFLTLTPTLI